MVFIGGPAEPLGSHRGVLWHAEAFRVHKSQIYLAYGVATLGNLAQQPCRLFVVLGNPAAFAVHNAKRKLSEEFTLLGCLAVPLCGLAVVLADSLPILIENAKV